MARPQLYLFVGYPGAGKTTVSQYIHELTGAVHIWADKERRDMFDEPTHSETESKQLYAYLNDETSRLLNEGKSVIFDTNFNFRRDRELLKTIAGDFGAETTVVWINTPKELAKQRAVSESDGRDTRVYGNMTEADFDRIASHLEPPDKSEKVIKIDGTKVDREMIKRILNL